MREFSATFDLEVGFPTGPVPIDDSYVALAYTPTLGPSALTLLRHLRWLHSNQYRHGLAIIDIAQGIGSSSHKARQSILKLTRHHLVVIDQPGRLLLPEFVPALASDHALDLPAPNFHYVAQFNASLTTNIHQRPHTTRQSHQPSAQTLPPPDNSNP